ncbi:AAA ATPase domain-containing protein [Trichoderma breve]|uniref:AAA ATPase domain-containing protein n=1 Tax=Trichoderma breve TaxID=2034170 RepID=A0A9W9B540_9HYPO|nr:AAA ATPase domain-containing protein [Trichoderma breve]KAJ4856480.1 AAA ATPase domain-containing protein [Trichoderma breve]
MDAITALGVASDILAIAEFSVRLLSTKVSSTIERKGEDKNSALEDYRKLRLALSNKNALLQRLPLASPSPALKDELALLELATSSLEDSEMLLETIGNIPEDISGNRLSPWRIDATTYVDSKLGGRFSLENVKRLSHIVTRHASSILSFRISELNKTIESLENVKQQFRPEQESRVNSISQDVENLRLEVQRRDRLTTLIKAEDNMFADKIVASLNYSSRPVRHDSVPQAHKNTFQWAFDSRLSKWFSSGSGIFWVSGKPGSGKSTFMKFIAKHSQTKDLLTQWAGSADTLAVAVHFFWIAGTPIQKSWQGLLHRWEAAKAGRWQTAAEPWSVSELTAALRALASADHMPLNICFFIDGLDEYDSDHAELCKVLCDMVNSPHIKMCLSSRPWDVFERSFGGEGKERLDIHELTRNDIREFVGDQLQEHPKWAMIESETAASEKSSLIEQIVAKADGVFLWAFFVTRSLRGGLSNGDRISDLSQRLSGLPTDLEQLFKHMLESVDPVDHPKMAGILQAAAHALEPLHIDLYWQLEREFEEHDYAYRCLIGSRPLEQISTQREQTTRSINDKTKGLLKLVNLRVEFLHRTVKDFVLTKDLEEYLRSKLPDDHNRFVSIATAYLGFLKTTCHDTSLVAGIMRHGMGLNSGPFISHLNQALFYASEALKADQFASHQYFRTATLLDKYEEAIEAMVRAKHVTIRGVNSEACHPALPFREELLKHNLTSYIEKRIREQPEFFNIFDESPLFAALTPMSLNSGESPAPVAKTLDLILQRGENPNVLPQVRGPHLKEAASPWMLFARGTMSVFNMLSGPLMFPALRWNDSLDNALFDLLLSYGAHPNKALLDRPGAHTVFSHFLKISTSRFLGEECFEGYLRTLDAFFRAGATLGVPHNGAIDPDALAAFGNLARSNPEESVLASYCTELKGLMSKLAADPGRARFLSAVTEKLIVHCSGGDEDLKRLVLAISEGLPQYVAEPLLQVIDSKLEMRKKRGDTRKRRRESWGNSSYGDGVKQVRGE